MRAPPAASVRCGGGPYWRFLLAALPALALMSLLVWLALHHCSCGPAALPAGFWLAAGALAAGLAGWRWRARADAPLLLSWDGANWHWQGEEAPLTRVSVTIDLDDWMLLHLQGAPWRERWQAVRRADNPQSWPRCRVALHGAAPSNEQLPTG